MATLQVGAAAVLVLALAFLPWRERSLAGLLGVTLLAAACWNCLRGFGDSATTTVTVHLVVTLLTVEFTAAGLLLTTYRLVRGRVLLSPWISALLVTVPLLVAGLLVTGVAADPADYHRSLGYAVHLAYGFGLLGSIVILMELRATAPSRHVLGVVRAIQALSVAMIVAIAMMPGATSLVAAAVCLVLVWAARHEQEWARVATVTASVMHTVDIVILVADDAGRLLEWNATADHVLTLMTGCQPRRGEDLVALLGLPSPFPDGALLDLRVEDADLPMELSVRSRHPDQRGGDQVLLLSPLDTPVLTPAQSPVSGELPAHDPATQTEARIATLRRIRQAATQGTPVVRCTAAASNALSANDLLFVIARRLESCAPQFHWGRLDEWTLLGTTDEVEPVSTPTISVQDLGVTVQIDVLKVRDHESVQSFVTRICRPTAVGRRLAGR